MNARSLSESVLLLGGLALSLAAFAEVQQTSSFPEAEMKMMDANQDGEISQAEHAAGAKKMFEKMDADRDSKVTAAEMDAAQKSIRGKHASSQTMSSAEKIKAVDANKDGILSAEEHTAGSRAMFQKMDSDKDGRLTIPELHAGHANMMSAPKH